MEFWNEYKWSTKKISNLLPTPVKFINSLIMGFSIRADSISLFLFGNAKIYCSNVYKLIDSISTYPFTRGSTRFMYIIYNIYIEIEYNKWRKISTISMISMTSIISLRLGANSRFL